MSKPKGLKPMRSSGVEERFALEELFFRQPGILTADELTRGGKRVLDQYLKNKLTRHDPTQP